MASNTPKQMSSRLATMKFMQRGASKNVPPSPSTPNGPPAKRVRLANGTSAPVTPTTPSEIPQSAEGRRQEEALARAAERAGETKWVLSVNDARFANSTPVMQVQHAGFAVIDAEEDSADEEEQRPVRMQFGGGVKKKQVTTATPTKTEDSESESESDDADNSDFSSDDPTAELIRETKRDVAAKQRDARKKQKLAVETPHRPKIVDEDAIPGGLSSLSGGGRAGGKSREASNVECFKCGQKGHYRDDCPEAPRGSAGRGRGGGVKGGKRGRR